MGHQDISRRPYSTTQILTEAVDKEKQGDLGIAIPLHVKPTNSYCISTMPKVLYFYQILLDKPLHHPRGQQLWTVSHF